MESSEASGPINLETAVAIPKSYEIQGRTRDMSEQEESPDG